MANTDTIGRGGCKFLHLQYLCIGHRFRCRHQDTVLELIEVGEQFTIVKVQVLFGFWKNKS